MSAYSAVECLFFSLLLAAIADVPVRSVIQVAAPREANRPDDLVDCTFGPNRPERPNERERA